MAPDPVSLDLAALLRPGDTVAWPGLAGEPTALLRLLDECPHPIRSFVSMGLETPLRPKPSLDATAMGGAGANRALLRGGAGVIPVSYSALPDLIASGRLRIDALLLHTTRPDAAGRCNVGVGIEHLGAAVERARVVVCEANEAMPWTRGDTTIASDGRFTFVPAARPLVEPPRRAPTEIERRVAENVAHLIPDRATLQLGIGAVPDAVPPALAGKSGLGIHSGIIGDGVLDLIEAGVVDNRHKEIDAGVTTTMLLLGGKRLYAWADRNERLAVRSPRHTHDANVLANFRRLVTVNSAIEVDLTGQVNAETLGGKHVGLVGGQVDFVRAGLRAPDGRSIIALPATTRDGKVSRIVARLADGVVTTPRSDADTIVTEHGIAELSGRTLAERARAMIAIADPLFRAALARAAEQVL